MFSDVTGFKQSGSGPARVKIVGFGLGSGFWLFSKSGSGFTLSGFGFLSGLKFMLEKHIFEKKTRIIYIFKNLQQFSSNFSKNIFHAKVQYILFLYLKKMLVLFLVKSWFFGAKLMFLSENISFLTIQKPFGFRRV